MKKNLTTRKIVYMALCIALNVVFVRFLSFQTFTLRFDFGFLPIVLSSILCGPFLGGITGALSDLVGMLVNSKGMTYFFPYTINAFLYGLTYGLFLYKKEHSLKRVIACVITEIIIINIGLSSLWGFLFMKYVIGNAKAFLVILSNRALMAIPIAVVQILGIEILMKYVAVHFKEKM